MRPARGRDTGRRSVGLLHDSAARTTSAFTRIFDALWSASLDGQQQMRESGVRFSGTRC